MGVEVLLFALGGMVVVCLAVCVVFGIAGVATGLYIALGILLGAAQERTARDKTDRKSTRAEGALVFGAFVRLEAPPRTGYPTDSEHCLDVREVEGAREDASSSTMQRAAGV